MELDSSISQAIQAAFGDEPLEHISEMSGGRSGATLILITVAGTDYVLKREAPHFRDQQRSEREFTCATIAAERGIAPRIRYADAATGISVVERVIGVPLGNTPQPIERITRTLRRLHTGPTFPAGQSVSLMVRDLEDQRKAQGRGDFPEPLVRTVEEIEQVLARFFQTAPCHNDLNPTNILCTDDAVYLLDWATACQSDPFVDLAQLSVFGFPVPEQRAALLTAYLERLPTEEETAHLSLARVLALSVYTIAFLQIPTPEGVPSLAETNPLPILELLQLLGTQPERATPNVCAASLLAEMQRESGAEHYASALRLLRS